MLQGEYPLTLDSKNRVVLPASLRRELPAEYARAQGWCDWSSAPEPGAPGREQNPKGTPWNMKITYFDRKTQKLNLQYSLGNT